MEYFYGVPMSDIMGDLVWKRVNIPKKRKPSLRKIRRHRKYFRLLNRVHRQIVRSKAFRQAIYDMAIFGRSETIITASDVRVREEKYWKDKTNHVID